MSSIPVTFPSRSFTSKSAAKNYVRDEIVAPQPLRVPIEDEAHHLLLSEILEAHEHAAEKIGPGIDYFYVEETWRLPGKEMAGKNQRAIIVVQAGGRHMDWSYRDVIDFPSVQAHVKSALAAELNELRVRRRDEDFASGVEIYCAVTGELITNKAHADARHIDPTWGDLTSGFVAQFGGWEGVETHSGDGEMFVGRGILREDIRLGWHAYYLANAKPSYVLMEEHRN